MAITSPRELDVARLRRRVEQTYENVARDPHGDFHFHRGLEFAVEQLGYDRAELESLPRIATDAFAGVGNPHRGGAPKPGDVVLDHACGAGMDLLIAARRVGPAGRAIGVDLTPGMRERARNAAIEAGLGDRVDIREGVFEALPVETGTVDVVLSNGVVNLAPDKNVVFREIARVLRPGGRLLLSDVIVQRELKQHVRADADLWAACIGGALHEPDLFELARMHGLEGAVIVERLDAFAGTTAGAKVSKDLRVQGVTFVATKRADFITPLRGSKKTM